MGMEINRTRVLLCVVAQPRKVCSQTGSLGVVPEISGIQCFLAFTCKFPMSVDLRLTKVSISCEDPSLIVGNISARRNEHGPVIREAQKRGIWHCHPRQKLDYLHIHTLLNTLY
jgi:hypothetical protein